MLNDNPESAPKHNKPKFLRNCLLGGVGLFLGCNVAVGGAVWLGRNVESFQHDGIELFLNDKGKWIVPEEYVLASPKVFRDFGPNFTHTGTFTELFNGNKVSNPYYTGTIEGGLFIPGVPPDFVVDMNVDIPCVEMEYTANDPAQLELSYESVKQHMLPQVAGLIDPENLTEVWLFDRYCGDRIVFNDPVVMLNFVRMNGQVVDSVLSLEFGEFNNTRDYQPGDPVNLTTGLGEHPYYSFVITKSGQSRPITGISRLPQGSLDQFYTSFE